MAKLNGVTLLDVTGGEVTKVSYESEEYSKVSGEAKDGDLMLMTDDSILDANKGDFFVVNEHGEWEDNAGSSNRDANYYGLSHRYRFFRKPARKGRVGDFLLAKSSDSFLAVTAGKTYEIKEFSYIDIVRDYGHYVIEGEDGTDTHLISDPSKSGVDYEIIPKSEAQKPQLNVGDAVKVIGKTYLDEIKLGTVAEITDTKDSDGDYRITNPTDNYSDYAQAESLEKISAAEAEEFVKWAEIGRKPNEFKAGDIVKGYGIHVERDVYGIVEDVSDSLLGVDEFGEHYTAVKDAELITPVDQRFDTKEDA